MGDYLYSPLCSFDNDFDMEDLFFARIDDLCTRADRGELAFSRFLNETEAAEAGRYLRSLGRADQLFWGGFTGAERKKLFVFPAWQEPSIEAANEAITPIYISGGGYVKLEHRSFLGSLVASGLSRDVIGDIILLDDYSAVVFFDDRIAEYLLSSPDALLRVGRDKVKMKRYVLPYGFGRREDYTGINATVSSPRLDCVISALTSLSREKAKSAVREGLVQVDHIQERDPDRRIEDGAVISIRGHGKFRVESIGEKTKKDRYRLLALKYN